MACTRKISHFLILFFPLLLTQLAQMGIVVFASMFSGRYGTVDLAGVAVGINIWYPVLAGVSGIFFGISPILSQLRGAQKTEEIPQYIQQSLYVALGMSALIFILGWAAMDPFLGILGLEPEVYAIAREFLVALAIGVIPTFLLTTMRYVTDAHGLTQISMLILLVNLAITLLFFRLFVLGGLGLAPLGGAGTGYAIALAAWVTFFIFAALFYFKAPFRSYRIWQTFCLPDWSLIRDQLRLGIPIFIAVFCETSLFSIVGLLMAEFGTLYLAANQAAISYADLVYIFPWSISLTATILVGYEVGAGNGKAARQYAKICQGAAFCIVMATALFTYTFIDPISELFSADPNVLLAVRTFLFLALVYSFCDAAGTPVQGILRGYKDVRIITIVAFVTYWLISIPLGYAMAHLTTYGPYGYWYSLIIGLGINAAALNLRLWKRTAWTL